MTTLDPELTTMHQAIGALQWPTVLMALGKYKVFPFLFQRPRSSPLLCRYNLCSAYLPVPWCLWPLCVSMSDLMMMGILVSKD